MTDSSYTVVPAGPTRGSPDAVVPVDPIPAGWPKDQRKAVEEFRASRPEVFGWSCGWHGSSRAFRKACARAFAVLELRHGPEAGRVDWVLISVRDDLWQAFLTEFRALPPERQDRIRANLAAYDEDLAARLVDRRVQQALEAAGGRVEWNTLEPFDRRLSFDQLADQMHLVPELVRAQFDGGLVLEVTFGRPAGCRVSVVDERGRSRSTILYERSVADGAELDGAVQEAIGLCSRRTTGPMRLTPDRACPVAEVDSPAPADDAASQAAQVARGWIRRTHHCPMRPTLVTIQDMMALVGRAVDSGQVPPGVSVDGVRDDEECQFGRWVRSSRACALDPVQATETRALHALFHHRCADVLAAVRDGQVDQARRLLEAEDGCASAARRLDQALRSWIGDHCEWSADGAVDHEVAPSTGP